jgi:uncharacterized protein (UPF0264 family)
MTVEELTEVIQVARREQFLIALAGSITFESLPDVMAYQPDWIAVRGAVCRAGREDGLERELVKRFKTQLSTPSMSNAATPDAAMIDSIANRA